MEPVTNNKCCGCGTPDVIEGVTVHDSCDDCRIDGNTHHDEACQSSKNSHCKKLFWCDAHDNYLNYNDSGDEDAIFENESCKLCKDAVDFKKTSGL